LREVLGLLSSKLPISPIPRGTSAPSFSIPPQDTLQPAASDGKRSLLREPHKQMHSCHCVCICPCGCRIQYIPFLSVDSLLPPKMPTKGEMVEVLLELRKRELVEEYFGN
jgi:hypothetical protein